MGILAFIYTNSKFRRCNCRENPIYHRDKDYVLNKCAYLINIQNLCENNCKTPITYTKIKLNKWKEINLLEMTTSKDVSSPQINLLI